MSSRSRNTLLILAVIACFGALVALGLLRFYTAKPPPAAAGAHIRFFRKVLGGHAAEHPSGPTIFGLRRENIDTPEAYRLYEECSPIEHARAGAPPVFLFYSDSKTPLAADSKPGAGMHHPAFGPPLKERVDAIGGVCILKHRDDYALNGGSFFQDASDFLKKYLR